MWIGTEYLDGISGCCELGFGIIGLEVDGIGE